TTNFAKRQAIRAPGAAEGTGYSVAGKGGRTAHERAPTAAGYRFGSGTGGACGWNSRTRREARNAGGTDAYGQGDASGKPSVVCWRAVPCTERYGRGDPQAGGRRVRSGL